MSSARRSAPSTGPHVCYYCGSPSWTTNRAWYKCDICGGHVWLDFDHPEAPPRYYARREARRRGDT